jgi:hypothetical protein
VIKPLVVGTGVLAVLIGVAVVNNHRGQREAKPTAARAIADAGSPIPAASALGCDDWPGLAVTKEFDIGLPQVGSLHQGAVVSWRCVDSAGVRHPSLVHVVQNDPASGNAHVVATLIKTSENMHVDRIVTSPGKVTVTASYWGPAPSGYFPGWRRPGGILSRSYVTTDGKFFTAMPPMSVATSCGAADLDARAISGPGPAGRAWLLNFVNKSARACAVEGMPTVVGHSGLTAPLTATRTLSGRVGGLRGDATAPPIVLLIPGELASAMVEIAGPKDSQGRVCPPAGRVIVSLPAAGEVASFFLDVSACDLAVHPVVAGSSGSSRG